MKFRPLHDRVVVKRLEEHKTKGGILIPDTAAEKPQTGKVIAAEPNFFCSHVMISSILLA